MKKIILFCLFLPSLYAEYIDAKIYLGVGYSNYHESFANLETQTSNNALKLKAGYGIREAYAVEFSLDYIDNASKTSTEPWKAKYGFNVELLKAFDLGIYINPYLKAGFGAGIIDNRGDGAVKSNTYGSFNLSTGFFIPLSEHYDFELSYEYNNLSYQKDNILKSENETSHVNIFYFGFNTRF